jgi:hypothetical protein
VPFKLEFSGSQILFADNEPDYVREEEDRAGRSIGRFRELTPPATVK